MADTRKTVLITGCSGVGIGNHLATTFHVRGLRVFATARNADSLSDLSKKGIEALSLTVDDPESVKACFTELEKRLDGRGLDYLVNNAGRNYTTPATDTELSEIQATFSTNLFAVVNIIQTFLPLLLASRGTIVNIGSVAGIVPLIWGSIYNASKAALHAYGDCLRVELAPWGIHVVTVVTGGVKSNIARTKRELKTGSLWEGFEQEYQARQVYSQTHGQDTGEYAKTVVNQVLNCRGRLWNQNEIWAGGRIGVVKIGSFLDQFIPGGLYGFTMSRMGGIQNAAKRKKNN